MGSTTTGPTVTKLVGAPGSGKTTTLLDFVEREATEYGVGLDELLFCTFTRSGRDEVQERIADVYPTAEERDLKTSVKTLHGAALSACLADGVLTLRNRGNLEADGQLLIRRTNPDDGGYFEWFYRKHFPHIQYDPEERDPLANLRDGGDPTDGRTGNRLMALYDYVKSKDWPLEHHYLAPIDVDLSSAETLDVLEAWEQFKDRNDLLQDDDYVKLALEHRCPPRGRVLLVDEFQDLSPLQYKLYEAWRDRGALERVYIAGDAHQAIYGFRGAEPTAFQQTHADKTIRREESKRCPKAVIDAAVPVAAPVAEHDVGGVCAARDGGSVDHLDVTTDEALADLVQECVDTHGEVHLLARTNRQCRTIANGLRNGGVPFLDLKKGGGLNHWKHPLPTLLAALRAFDDGRNLPVPVAQILLENASDATARHDAKRSAENGVLSSDDPIYGDFIPPEEYRQWFPNAETPLKVVPQLAIDGWRAELLEGALKSTATHDPEDVRVGTIHAAKGLEAPCVLTFPAYTHKQLERYYDGAEAEERRLYYVALTRASDTAVVVHDYLGGETFPPLEH